MSTGPRCLSDPTTGGNSLPERLRRSVAAGSALCEARGHISDGCASTDDEGPAHVSWPFTICAVSALRSVAGCFAGIGGVQGRLDCLCAGG